MYVNCKIPQICSMPPEIPLTPKIVAGYVTAARYSTEKGGYT